MHTWPAPVIEGSRGVLILSGVRYSPTGWGHLWRFRSGGWRRDAGGPRGYIERARNA